MHLRSLLAGPFLVIDAGSINQTEIDLWSTLDGAITLPNGKRSAKSPVLWSTTDSGRPERREHQADACPLHTESEKRCRGVVNLLFEFGVGDLIGTNIFAQGQSGVYVARTVTLAELGDYLNSLVPNKDVSSLSAVDWSKVRDALNAAGRFTAEQLATVNKELVAGTDSTSAVTQLDKLKELANAEFYKAVADEFTEKVNALPAVDASRWITRSRFMRSSLSTISSMRRSRRTSAQKRGEAECSRRQDLCA